MAGKLLAASDDDNERTKPWASRFKERVAEGLRAIAANPEVPMHTTVIPTSGLTPFSKRLHSIGSASWEHGNLINRPLFRFFTKRRRREG
jgi:hypothetical protein